MAIPVALAAALPAVSSLLTDIFDGLSAEKKAEAAQALKALEMAQAEAQSQAQVNATEAAHRSLFVAGWRPFVGWVCGASLLYAFIAQPSLAWIMEIAGTHIATPQWPMDYLMELLFGMLGLGGLRTLEKVKGVAR